jgi:hypothetical protein
MNFIKISCGHCLSAGIDGRKQPADQDKIIIIYYYSRIFQDLQGVMNGGGGEYGGNDDTDKLGKFAK